MTLPQANAKNALPAITAIVIALPVLAVIGIAISLGLTLPSIGIAAIFGATLFYFALMQLRPDRLRMDAHFWFLLSILFVSSTTKLLTGINISFLMEATIYIYLPLVAYNLWPRVDQSNSLKLVVFLVLVYIIVSIISSFLGRTHFRAGAYQFISNLKPIALLGLGMTLAWTTRTENNFWRMIQWSWIIFLAGVAIQWSFPGIYDKIYQSSGFMEGKMHPYIPGVPRALAIFHHSAVLGSIAALFSIFSLIRYLSTRQHSFLLAAFIYFLLIIFSGQRQELAAYFAILILLILTWSHPGRLNTVVISTALISTMSIILILIISNFTGTSIETYLNNSLAENQDVARFILYRDSIRLANDYWPLGSGLGTFGGAGALKFDQSLYYALGYAYYWWFGTGLYLTDSFWATYIAETGWVGTTIFVSALILVLYKTARWFTHSADKKQKLYSALAFFAYLWCLITSPTSYVLVEPTFGVIGMIFVGIAYRMTYQASTSKNVSNLHNNNL